MMYCMVFVVCMVHVQTAAEDQTCAGTTERRRVARVGSQAVAVREAVCISVVKVSHGRRGTDMVSCRACGRSGGASGTAANRRDAARAERALPVPAPPAETPPAMATAPSDAEPHDDYTCAITTDLMADPVMAYDGFARTTVP